MWRRERQGGRRADGARHRLGYQRLRREKFCGLVTTKFLEQTTGAKGDKADDACKKQIDSLKNPDLKITKITKVEVDGDDAKVSAELESSGQKRPQVFTLKKEDGEFRLASANQ